MLARHGATVQPSRPGCVCQHSCALSVARSAAATGAMCADLRPAYLRSVSSSRARPRLRQRRTSTCLNSPFCAIDLRAPPPPLWTMCAACAYRHGNDHVCAPGGAWRGGVAAAVAVVGGCRGAARRAGLPALSPLSPHFPVGQRDIALVLCSFRHSVSENKRVVGVVCRGGCLTRGRTAATNNGGARKPLLTTGGAMAVAYAATTATCGTARTQHYNGSVTPDEHCCAYHHLLCVLYIYLYLSSPLPFFWHFIAVRPCVRFVDLGRCRCQLARLDLPQRTLVGLITHMRLLYLHAIKHGCNALAALIYAVPLATMLFRLVTPTRVTLARGA